MRVVNTVHSRKKTNVCGNLFKILPQIPKLCGQFPALIIVYQVKLALGHIPPQLQQFPDTGCRLFPGDERGAGTLGALALGYADFFGIVPDGILAPIQIEARAVFPIVFCEETGIVRLILFEIGADD